MPLKKREGEIVERLIVAGIPKNSAKTLAVLLNMKAITSREIETRADLRQPEVSLSIRYLMGRGWINKTEKKNPGKGRPTHIYKLNAARSKLLNEIRAEEKERMAQMKQNITRLEELIA